VHDHEFINDLVDDISSNGAEFVGIHHLFHFRNKGEKGGIQGWKDSRDPLRFLIKGPNICFDHQSTRMEEVQGESISA